MGNCLFKPAVNERQAQLRRPSSVYTDTIDESNKKKKKKSNGNSIFLPDEDDVSAEPRVISCEESISTTLGRMKIRYAYYSQRGYYPDDKNKPNQDSYNVTQNFNNNPNDALFSVYDGHGKYGDKCAQFAKEHLPNLIARHMEKLKVDRSRRKNNNSSSNSNDNNNNNNNNNNDNSHSINVNNNGKEIELNKEMTQRACQLAHKQCNKAMHDFPTLNDDLSGTTAISAFFQGHKNRITVSNVGDSRAVLGQRVNRGEGQEGYFRALPLSRDQTPYRRDERKRIRTYGARILSLDQIEGLEPILVNDSDDDDDGRNDKELGKEIDEDGDPPRVWHPKSDYPGTAFTRSLGDALAEALGVIAEPEMVTRELEEGDQIIVLASDGVFEFLTNQSVIDMCAKFKDPMAACKAVVAESYELWLQYELRTDDITMICIFIDSDNDDQAHNLPSPDVAKSMDSFEDNGKRNYMPDALKIERESKPVRSRPSVEKSQLLRKMSSNLIVDDEQEFDISALYTEKSAQEKACIAQAIKACVMLQSITDDQRDMIYGVMEPVVVKTGELIIQQGTVGDRFYIVEEGKFEVRIVPEGQAHLFKNGGMPVHVYEGSLENHAHPSFGELALLYSVPRAASIIALTDGKLWALHKTALRKVLVEQSGRQELLKVLRNVEVLQNFREAEVEYIAGTMKLETFGKGHIITAKDSRGDALYVISKGQCEVAGKKGYKLSAGQYFGEEVIVAAGSDKYIANVRTTTKTSCWVLEKNVIETLKKQFEQ